MPQVGVSKSCRIVGTRRHFLLLAHPDGPTEQGTSALHWQSPLGAPTALEPRVVAASSSLICRIVHCAIHLKLSEKHCFRVASKKDTSQIPLLIAQ